MNITTSRFFLMFLIILTTALKRDVFSYDVLFYDDTLNTNFWLVITGSERQGSRISIKKNQLLSNAYSNLSNGLIVSYDSFFFDKDEAAKRLAVVKKSSKGAYLKNVGSYIVNKDKSCVIDKKAIKAGTVWTFVNNGYIFSSGRTINTKNIVIKSCKANWELKDTVQTSASSDDAKKIICTLLFFGKNTYAVLFNYYSDWDATDWLANSQLTVFELQSKKIVWRRTWSEDRGNSEITSLYNKNGVPALITRRTDSDSIISELKWNDTTFKFE